MWVQSDVRTSPLCWTSPHVFKKIKPRISHHLQISTFILLFFLKSTDAPDFVQRPAQRPKMASSVPLRSWWRRSSRLRGCGRATARGVRGSSWPSSSRTWAGPAAGTAPYPEAPTRPTEATPGKEEEEVEEGRWNWTGALRRRAGRGVRLLHPDFALFAHFLFTTHLSPLGRGEHVEFPCRVLTGSRPSRCALVKSGAPAAPIRF